MGQIGRLGAICGLFGRVLAGLPFVRRPWPSRKLGSLIDAGALHGEVVQSAGVVGVGDQIDRA
jgi:hypothetical protein